MLRLLLSATLSLISAGDAGVRIVVDAKLEEEAALQWLERGGWCWGVAANKDGSDSVELLTSARKRGFVPTLGLYASEESRHKEWPDNTPNLTEALSRQLESAGGDASQVVWSAFVEEDSAGVAFPQLLMRGTNATSTSAQAFGLWTEHVAEVWKLVEPWQRQGVEVWGRVGFPSSAHSVARLGVDALLVERANDDLGDLQPAIAFVRGAAHQFGLQGWGVDLSLWWGAISGCAGDLPASFFRRYLYFSLVAGANVYEIESVPFLREDGSRYPIAVELDEFGRLALNASLGQPEVPVAVLLPQDNGWTDMPPYWATTADRASSWNFARLQRQPGDRGIDGLFGTLWPGAEFAAHPWPFGKYEDEMNPPASPFALESVGAEFAVKAADVFHAQSPIPFGSFHDRKVAGEFMRDGTAPVDPSPYRPLGDTRWGAVVNVLTDHAETLAQILPRYQVLVVAGQVQVTDELLARFTDFVSAGGTLVLPLGVAGPALANFTGVEVSPELRVARSWRWMSGALRAEALLYAPLREPLAGSRALAVTRSREPLVVERSMGAGRILTVLVPWFEGHGDRVLSGPARELLELVVPEVQPVLLHGPPAMLASSRRKDGARSVVVGNNDGDLWQGTVELRHVESSMECKELRSGVSILSRYDGEHGVLEFELSIPAYDVQLVQCAEAEAWI